MLLNKEGLPMAPKLNRDEYEALSNAINAAYAKMGVTGGKVQEAVDGCAKVFQASVPNPSAVDAVEIMTFFGIVMANLMGVYQWKFELASGGLTDDRRNARLAAFIAIMMKTAKERWDNEAHAHATDEAAKLAVTPSAGRDFLQKVQTLQ